MKSQPRRTSKFRARPAACLSCDGRRNEVFRVIRNLDTNTDRLFPRFAVSLCRDCGLVQQNPRLPRRRMDSLYERLEDKITEGKDDRTTAVESLDRLRALRHLKAPPARLLEIGCSDGTFLDLARKAGYEAVGVDPSKANVRKAAAKFPGLDVRRTLLEGLPAAETFDLICHFFVLEHVFDPRAFLDQARRRLRPGGLMFLEVPNVESFVRLPFINNLFVYQHVAHYSPATLAGLFGRAGFRSIPVPGGDRPSSKSYGMRAAAKPGPARAVAASQAAASRRLLTSYFSRQDGLLSRLRRRAGRWARDIAGRQGPVVVFGAGENGRILRSELHASSYWTRDFYFCDNSPALRGTRVDGFPVLAPTQVPGLRPALVIAASIDYQDDMKRQMIELGLPPERVVKLYAGF